eukprot:GHUV01036922.1.p1 GENE.GHUV01036922.1~~GHUV01036922.1.p1  ORF type:complete len:178 (-),score=20.98 GHUV01036922.1:464-997(-)
MLHVAAFAAFIRCRCSRKHCCQADLYTSALQPVSYAHCLFFLLLQMSHSTLGQDTFKGIGNSSPLRGTLYGKSPGEVDVKRDLLSVHSPISGSTLTAPDVARHTAIKDPISGATLQLSKNQAQVVAPVLRQEQVCSAVWYCALETSIGRQCQMCVVQYMSGRRSAYAMGAVNPLMGI